MASAFGHALSAYALTTFFPIERRECTKVILLAIICAIIPDVDVLAFNFNIPYSHPFGHRGFTHSFFFAAVFALAIRYTFFASVKRYSKKGWILFIIFFVSTGSHGILDAMTTGGRGVAFFGPFDNTRHFLPWRMIRVSPLSAARFFSARGWEVIRSEAVWIGVPSLIVIVFNYWRRRVSNKK
jgi:inner membrane protein